MGTRAKSQLTVDVSWLEWSVSLSTTTSGRGGSSVLSLFLSNVGGPVLLHYGAGDDVEHRILHVLLDESTEGGVIELWRVDGGLVLVGFAVRQDLRARYASVSRKRIPDVRKLTRASKNKNKKQLTGSNSRKCDESG